MILTGENRSTGGRNLSQCQFVYHTTHTESFWDWNQASAVRGRRLIAPTASSKFSNHVAQRLVQNTYSAAQCVSRIRNFIAVTMKACHETLTWIRSIHFHILSQPFPTCAYVRNLLTEDLDCRITVRLKTRLSPCSSQHQLSLSRKYERLYLRFKVSKIFSQVTA